jgi:hypothetical protein
MIMNYTLYSIFSILFNFYRASQIRHYIHYRHLYWVRTRASPSCRSDHPRVQPWNQMMRTKLSSPVACAKNTGSDGTERAYLRVTPTIPDSSKAYLGLRISITKTRQIWVPLLNLIIIRSGSSSVDLSTFHRDKNRTWDSLHS